MLAEEDDSVSGGKSNGPTVGFKPTSPLSCAGLPMLPVVFHRECLLHLSRADQRSSKHTLIPNAVVANPEAIDIPLPADEPPGLWHG